MKDQVLLFQIPQELLPAIRMSLMAQKIGAKVVQIEEFGQKIGYLAEVKGIEPVQGAPVGEMLSEPMMVLCMPQSKLDGVLASLRRAGLPFIQKAMLTPTNAHWTAAELLAEMHREREKMRSQMKKS